MQSARPVTIDEIDAARRKIVALILDQCEFGEQTKALGNDAQAACGQFIGDGARPLTQRGMHGTSAAIAVLADSFQTDPKAQAILPRLVRYASDITSLGIASQNSPGEERIEATNDNVIKNAELLLAISGVSGVSVANTDNLKRRLTAWLKESKIDDKGWSYFGSEKHGQNPTPHLLPTAYALMALDAVNEDSPGPVQFVLSSVAAAANGSNGSDADVTIRILALYALAFRDHANQRSPVDTSRLKELFESHWTRVESLLRSENIEQNVEYWRGEKTYYVRVPWQLYLLALAAKLNMRRFASAGARFRIREVVTSLINGQFRYPHSGKMISTRANGIAYETLGHIRHSIGTSSSFSFFVLLDRVRNWRLWKVLAGCFAALVVGYSALCWITGEGNKQFIDLAPNFVSGFVIFILLWGRRR